MFNPLLRSWEKYFTIAQWDQRGAGKTFHRNGKDGSGSITFGRLAQDGIEVAEYLCSKLNQPKLILIGSSVGSLTGLLMASLHPELFYAYVGTDQNAPDPEHIYYQSRLDAFRSIGSKKGIQLMEKMGPDVSKWSMDDFKQNNQLVVKAIRGVPNMIMDLILPSMIASPDHKLSDIFDIFKGMDFSLEHLYDELIHFDYSRFNNRFELPFFIFHGESDIITPTAVAKMYYEVIEAPYKEFVTIRHAGHLACFGRPDQFLDELIHRVRPLATVKR
ncbi:alpha/beta hydrolase [Paenibacillus sp. KQZ6P-2]|uniref:Alpha/beta hydrolase n=1 Tax=Paenibacillus mangrovi TaxID=2931978 RepID=A0A9X2B1U5_9BACL|nr:alpha/beta hydrolase [Paenibacillus mangrovi]